MSAWFGGSGYELFPGFLCEAVFIFIRIQYMYEVYDFSSFVFLFCSEHSPSLRPQTEQITTDSSMTRTFLPPADHKTTTLPPRSSIRQHHPRLAGPRCAVPSCFYRILRSITQPHHLVHLYTPMLLLAVRVGIIRAQDSPEPTGNS